MLLEQKRQIQQLISNINTYSNLFKGIKLRNEIQSINTSLYYDDKYNTEKTINEIVYTSGVIISFNTYEELYSYLQGMNDFIDMIDNNIKVESTGAKYDM